MRVSVPLTDGSCSAHLETAPAGRGPGVVVLQEIFGVNETMRAVCRRFAERGFTALCPDLFWRLEPDVELDARRAEDRERAMALYQALDEDRAVEDAVDAVRFLRSHPAVDGRVAVVGYCLGGKLAYRVACAGAADAGVGYYGVGIEETLDEAQGLAVPLLLHFGTDDPHCPAPALARIRAALEEREGVTVHLYEGAGHAFARPGGEAFDPSAAELADLRTFDFLQRRFARARGRDELVRIWEDHVRYEFETRDVDATLDTMVEEAYVNHVPTLTGGVGREALRAFYAEHFIPKMPADTDMVAVSRTVDAERVVDEMVFRFTHDLEMDWMLPGVAPTGRRVEVPLVAIVRLRDGKLVHEHIYWDQASVLVQLGLLDPDRLPVLGGETARKVLDPRSQPSNRLLRRVGRGPAADGA